MLRFSSQIKGTPFSLCVVIPQRSRLQQLRMGSFPTPVDDHYHRLDVLAEEDELCQHISQTATKGQHRDHLCSVVDLGFHEGGFVRSGALARP